MFDIPITMTERAADRIKSLMPSGESGLRIDLKKGGCAGMEYKMDIVSKPEKNDLLVEQNGARVLLAPTAQMFLIGTEIDFKTSLLESGFTFRNPNVSDSCGCGESVSFSVDELKDQQLDSEI